MFFWVGTEAPRISEAMAFARESEGRQTLVLSLRGDFPEGTTMVLAIPAVDGDVSIDLEWYPDFFEDLGHCWPRPILMDGGWLERQDAERRAWIAAHRRGSFTSASAAEREALCGLLGFLDPDGKDLAGNEAYAFAAFHLSSGTRQEIPPMAIRFRTRSPDRLWFPMRERSVAPLPDVARLYYQPGARTLFRDERASSEHTASFVHEGKAKGLVDLERPVCLKHLARADLQGNHDFFVVESARTMADLYMH